MSISNGVLARASEEGGGSRRLLQDLQEQGHLHKQVGDHWNIFLVVEVMLYHVSAINIFWLAMRSVCTSYSGMQSSSVSTLMPVQGVKCFHDFLILFQVFISIATFHRKWSAVGVLEKEALVIALALATSLVNDWKEAAEYDFKSEIKISECNVVFIHST